MDKQTFLAALQDGLRGLPPEDVRHWVEFYGEMVEDRMEDGMDEAEAVAALGSVHQIIAQILSETSLSRLVQEKVKPKRPLRAWEIVLLVIGSPIWVPLAFAAVLLFLVCYVVVWVCIFAIYAVDLSLAVTGVALILSIFFSIPSHQVLAQVFFLGTGLVSGGLSVVLFLASGTITARMLQLSKKALLAIKFRFVRKEATL